MQGIVFGQREFEAALHFGDGLGGGVLELVLVQGEELGTGSGVAGEGQGEAGGCGGEDGLGGSGQRLGQAAAEGIKEGLGGGVDGAGLRGDVKRERQVGFAGDADFAADEPVDVGAEVGFAGGLEGVGEGDGKEDFVFVAEIHEWAEGQAAGRGELHGAGGDAGGEVPVDGGGFAGVAGVAPVDVPAFIQFEVQADEGRGSGLQGGLEG